MKTSCVTYSAGPCMVEDFDLSKVATAMGMGIGETIEDPGTSLMQIYQKQQIRFAGFRRRSIWSLEATYLHKFVPTFN